MLFKGAVSRLDACASFDAAHSILLFMNQWDTRYYFIQFGIPSGSKSIKRYPVSDDIIFIHTCVISFLTNQLAVFLCSVNHLWFFKHLWILYNKKKITWSLGDRKFLFAC